jgi:MFS family permease
MMLSIRRALSRAATPEQVPNPRHDLPRGLPPVRGGGLKRGFAAFGVRNYRLYWSGQVVSATGTWMQMVSLPWLVLALGGSPLQLGMVAALQFAPAMVLAPFGGVLADRVDKRRALIGTQLAAMLQAGTLFALAISGVIQIPHVFALALMLGLINAVDMPIRQSLAADLVPRQILPNAIALNSMAFNSARVVGPAVAGVIIAVGAAAFGSQVVGVGINLGINTLTYLAVLIALLRMNPAEIRRSERPEHELSVLHSLVEGLSYARRTPYVFWSLVLLGGVAAFGFNFQILLPLFAQTVLELTASGYGALFAALGIGSLAGSLTLAFMRRRRALRLMIGGGLVFAVLEIGLGLTRTAWIAYPIVAGAGYFSMLMVNTINATVQANVTDQLRGRVMALYVTVFAGSAPAGGLIAGAMAEAWGAAAAFIVGAVLSAAVVALVAWRLHGARGAPIGGSVTGDAEDPRQDRADKQATERLRPDRPSTRRTDRERTPVSASR